ncbi:amidohydrolase family protein [Actinoplanes italicus]|uniref:Putative TIM-barrel fold metal-dependent hydrolase n=1 Tax=Actinoplanes italicus TaxID=113567 RepID=A0A2T0K5F3_9ACTN|nr:amidohydrolase family protein [Actinoplanes italicus]PRX18212.1 putative TIM-barrel fold metal-dependent hydrolase [Actinoplanes italicus]
MLIDCHQHLWPEALVEALRRRDTFPYLRDWTLYLAGENPYQVDPAAHDVGRRRAAESGRVLLSLSSPLGIEHAPDGADLIDVWHTSALELPDPFHLWAAASVHEPDPEALARVLREDRVAGLQLPATALGGPDAIVRLAPLLDVLERSGKPLLVHPGPAAAEDGELPDWWPALVPYVAQMHRSWMAWHVAGRKLHPALRIAFVALAGLAPLHHERLAARGGPVEPPDPNVFYETSSYRAAAIEALAGVVGPAAIVHGSDRPYAQPLDPAEFPPAYFTINPQNLLRGYGYAVTESNQQVP